MKNKIIIALVFLVPIIAFTYLQNTSKNLAQAHIKEDEAGKPKLIKFYSPMCSECKTVGKNLDNVLPDYIDNIVYEEFDVTERNRKVKNLIKDYDITVVPTLIFIDKENMVVFKKEGMIEEEEIKSHIDEIKQ